MNKRTNKQYSRCDHPGCDGNHIPNKETTKILQETEAGMNLKSHNSLEAFWKAMGTNPGTCKSNNRS